MSKHIWKKRKTEAKKNKAVIGCLIGLLILAAAGGIYLATNRSAHNNKTASAIDKGTTKQTGISMEEASPGSLYATAEAVDTVMAYDNINDASSSAVVQMLEQTEEMPVPATETPNEDVSADNPIQETPAEEIPQENQMGNSYLVVIDAGHQRKGNSQQEPLGPGSSQTKAMVTGGTSGCVSGLAEYELNLQVSLKLQAELLGRGYQVIMVRTSHDVNISNSQRAAVANEAHADVFLRIHANGSEDSSVNGAITICQTKNNPYNGNLYSQSRALSDSVLDAIVSATGCKKQYVWETDSMSGINWCQVPVTIVEMGYMSNPEEDRLLASEEYQDKMVQGIANGVDAYFSGR